ncbi:MAG: Hint domain-containing protein, partial [Bacteriovoracaceae bacterium]
AEFVTGIDNGLENYASFLDLGDTRRYIYIKNFDGNLERMKFNKAGGGKEFASLPAVMTADKAKEEGINYKYIFDKEEDLNVSDHGVTIGDQIDGGFALSIPPQQVRAIRFEKPEGKDSNDSQDKDKDPKEFLKTDDEDLTRCLIAMNMEVPETESPRSLFVPTNSHSEFESFANTMNKGGVKNIKLRPCKAAYKTFHQIKKRAVAQLPENPTPKQIPKNPNGSLTWIGKLSCNQLIEKPACNQTKIITAERYCMLEDGKPGDCEECAKAYDPDADIKFTLASVAPNGDTTKAQILSSPSLNNKCFFSAACFSVNAAGCPSAGTSGGHVFCLSEDTEITMEDGSKLAIGKVKAGDKVKAFKAQNSKGDRLYNAKVVAVAVTEDQEIMRLVVEKMIMGKKKEDKIKITPKHKVVLSTGRGVMVQDLRPGVMILDSKGEHVRVKSIEYMEEKIAVYNLVLEDGADGYIAGGLKVLSYPMLDELASR